MKTIVIANQKGGIGKTTTATNLAHILTTKGYKTLLIDSDQQANSTDTYKAMIEERATLYDVLMGDHVSLLDAVQHTESGDIIPSDPLLREADAKLSSDPEGAYRMSMAIEELTGYDYVIIDTAPSLNWILRNCLVAADEVVIPITTDRYGLQGLSNLNDTIKAVKKRQNAGLKIAGLLLIKYNGRTTLGKEVSESLQIIAGEMETKVFDTKIRESVKTREAQALRTPLLEYAPKSTTAEDYISFVYELLKGEN